MKQSNIKESLKAILIGGISITMFGAIFFTVNNYVFASNLNKPIAIPTSYQDSPKTAKKSSDYVKANYSVVENNLLPCTNSNAISVKKAADIGAEYLWDMFKADLNGTTIQMSFSVSPSRAIAYWHGDVFENYENRMSSPPKYSFSIEAISGIKDSAMRENIISGKNISYKKSETDNYYKTNGKEFLELAKIFSEKHMASEPIRAEFIGTVATATDKYSFKIPEGKITTISPVSPIAENPNLIEISPEDRYEATFVNVEILLTDKNENQTIVSIDSTTKSLVSIYNIYKGIDYNPNGIG